MYYYYDCGICDCLHPAQFAGDCRDDTNRFALGDLDDKHGAENWTELEMKDADNYPAYVEKRGTTMSSTVTTITEVTTTTATERPWAVKNGQQIYSGERGIVWVSGDDTTNAEDEANAALIVEAVNSHTSLVAEVGRLRGATEAALSLLRRFRDEKPKQWDAIVDADACDVWDSLVAALRSGGE